jgi:hypothetical protein
MRKLAPFKVNIDFPVGAFAKANQRLRLLHIISHT